jgi:hypothetical protein
VIPIAHVGGLPVEETLGSFGPALLLGLGVAWTKLRARWSDRDDFATGRPREAGPPPQRTRA